MRSIQQKLMLYIVIIGIVPMMFFTFYYYNFSRNSLLNRLESESKGVLEQFDNKIIIKLNRIQNTVDILFKDKEFLRLLKETEKNSEDERLLNKKLDFIYESFLRGEKQLVSLVVFPTNGGMCISGNDIWGEDTKMFLLQYDNSRMNSGELTWLGLTEHDTLYENDVLVAGIPLRDTAYNKDGRYLGTVYMIFDNSLFLGDTVQENSSIDDSMETHELHELGTGKENISIYDENINLVYTIGDKSLSDAFLSLREKDNSVSFMDDLNSFISETDEDKYMVSSYTSRITGWKFVRTFSYKQYEFRLRNIIYITIFCFIAMLILWYFVNGLVVRRMTLPIRELLDAMMQVKKENFDVEIKVKAGKDFTIINDGFNSMVRHIKELFERVLSEEKKRREQDILLLQYQINPHFLYNTLGMIRGIALCNKQNQIAQMLLVLSRFLRKAISATHDMLSIGEEIENIKDYVSLYQLRYCNQLNFSIDADETCMNYRVPAMLVQPIIENALLHGLHDKFYNGEMSAIQIKINEAPDALVVSVYDNGCGISEEKISRLFIEEDNTENEKTPERLHIGLKSIQKRIQLIFGEGYGVTIESEEGKYTLVKIRLPKIKNIRRDGHGTN